MAKETVRERKVKTPPQVLARVKRELPLCCPVAAEGTVVLNPGFFTLENMRTRQTAKARAVVKRQAKGK